jgi:voltage-gated potassium channel
MTAYTVPDLQEPPAGRWILTCLWCCLGYFAIDTGVRARIAIQAGMARHYLLSASGFADVISVIAVPVALLYGANPPTAWLWASL